LHFKKPTNQNNQRNFIYEETPVVLMKPASMNRPDGRLEDKKTESWGSIFRMDRKPIHKTKICSTFQNYKFIPFTKLKFRACP
jgi:hypothetical protein